MFLPEKLKNEESNLATPHSRSGRAHALEFITPVRLCSPLALTCA